MKGYYKMPEETESAIRDGWLYTGDMAKRDENGYFYIVDRKKDLVIVGGYNVYPREVEEVLFAHRRHRRSGSHRLARSRFRRSGSCICRLKRRCQRDKEALIAYCAARLAKYKVPKQIEFLDELPKNTTGKILRRLLKDQVQQLQYME